MSSYFQMGHHMENLVGEDHLNNFEGIILSPVNRLPDELMRDIPNFREKGEYDIIFDSQLYIPRSVRDKLLNQPYFPSDFDTADYTSDEWWMNLMNSLTAYISELDVDAVVSPVLLPKIWGNEFYSHCVKIDEILRNQLEGTSIRHYISVLVKYEMLSDMDYILSLTSIVTRTKSRGFYIVVESDIEPRYEFSSSEEIFGLLYLISLLKETNKTVILSNCSSEMVLFKFAGADVVATGKYFNLRRFSKERYDEPASGGAQYPYWFEHNLFAFLREADVLRIQQETDKVNLGGGFSSNFWASEIQNILESGSGNPWVRLGWRQYLCWFSKTEKLIDDLKDRNIVNEWLKNAENNWLSLDDDNILLEEPRNNGSWIRPWRQAINSLVKKN